MNAITILAHIRLPDSLLTPFIVIVAVAGVIYGLCVLFDVDGKDKQ